MIHRQTTVIRLSHGIIAAATFATFLFPGIALGIQDCTLNGQDVNPNNGYTTEGKSGIMICRDRDSGVLEREQELRNGNYIGLVRDYIDGKLSSEYRVNKHGNRDGLYRQFSPNGKVVLEETARNGTSVGISRSWYQSGRLKRVVFNDDNGREQAEVEFTPSGQLKSLHCADRPLLGSAANDAHLCGHDSSKPVTSKLYSDKGIVHTKVRYLAGVRTAQESLWDDGKVQEENVTSGGRTIQRRFSRGGVKTLEVQWVAVERGRVKELEQMFHQSGSMISETRWENGKLASESSFYLNGQPKTHNSYATREGRMVCDAVSYHDNGQPSARGTYVVKNGYTDFPIGIHREFDGKGLLLTEHEYDNKGRLKREKEFNGQGKLLRDDEVFEDGSRKAFVTGK
jgi:antitoxin component YwqK of YwqJK toxin-antitoxin module